MSRRPAIYGTCFCALLVCCSVASMTLASTALASGDSWVPNITGEASFGDFSTGDAASGCESAGGYGCESRGCESTGCGDIGCGDVCCDSWLNCNSWLNDGHGVGSLTFRVGLLFMKRESPSQVPLVIDDNGIVLRGSDFDFDYEVGAEASVIWDRGNFWAPVEFRYMWINDWSDSRSASGLVNPRVNTQPPLGVSNPMNYADYKSELQTFELQFRRELCNSTLLLGLRYVSLDEDLDMLFGGADQFWIATENDLFGFQVGLEKVLYDNCCNFRIEGFMKAGIYGNDANVSASLLSSVSEHHASQQGGMDHVSFLGELGLIAEYDLSCCWTLRAGYQAMWIDGVLTAAKQTPATNRVTAAPVSYDYTTAFYHGGQLQLERRW